MRKRAALAVWAAAFALAVPAQTPTAARQTRHALLIAIGDYADPAVEPLPGIEHDIASARRMAQAMAVPDSQLTVLRDRQATAQGIRDAISALQSRVQDGDRVFVYFSGHGTRWYDPAVPAGGCTEGLLAADGQVLGNTEMGARLAPLARRADKLLVFYDTCFSGGIAAAAAAAAARTRTFAPGQAVVTPKFSSAGSPQACAQASNFRTRSLAQTLQQSQALPQNVVHVAASRPDELSFDSSTRGGYATAAWRDCLLGEARDLDGSGAITVDEVTQCAQAKVSAALAGQAGISGQRLTVAGNAAFVPAWMGGALETGARAARPAEILTELHGQRDGARTVSAVARRGVLKIGVDPLQLDITPSRDGYLYIAQAGSDGRSLYLLYPNQLAADNRVRAGRALTLPAPGWEIVAAGPPGPETLLVMVTDAPRDLGGLATEAAGPFMKTLLDGKGRALLQGVLAGGTPAPGCGQAGKPGCSDAYGSALLRIETVN